MNLNCTILLSYSRCANSWLRFCIEAISGQPTYPDNDYIKELRNNITVKGDYILRKEHSLDDTYNEECVCIIDNNDIYHKQKLIFLLRNYKECIIKQEGTYNDAIVGKQEGQYNYMENLIEYDKWPDDKKLLVYYETLIVNPNYVLNECVKFLDLNVDKANEFIDNYTYYKDLSIKSYDNNTEMGSSTKGKGCKHHSKILTKEQHKEWDDNIRKHNPEMFDKYLSIYKES